MATACNLHKAARAAGDWRKAASMLNFALLGGALALAVAPAAAQAGESPARTRARAVVELFTSQGCAWCPPADTLMCNYARDDSMVVLTLPVTCWDYLGWRDTLANNKFTVRQRIYAKLRGARSIYTPQVVINGVAHAVGSDDAALKKALTKVSTAPSGLPVRIDIARDGERFRVVIAPDDGTAGRATVLLAPFYQQRTVAIEGGENKGLNVTYSNVARDLVPLAQLVFASSPAAPVVIDINRREALPDDTDGFAVLVQSGDTHTPGRMLGAASFRVEKDASGGASR